MYIPQTYKQSQFVNNTAASAVGALEVDDGGSIDRCVFTSNSAPYIGAVKCKGPCSIINSVFNNNSATSIGGGVSLVSDNISEQASVLLNSSFSNNKALVSGAALITSTNTTVIGCSFRNNMVNESDGGAIQSFAATQPVNLLPLTKLIVIDSFFENNTAAVSGGAIQAYTVLVVEQVISQRAL
jgi:predicted outer membrane repeat protein